MDRLLHSETTQIIITLLLAVLGGAARILSRKDKNGVNAANVLSGCLVACFTGLLAHFAAAYFSLSENIAYIISGICGWLGPQAIDVFANIVLQKAGINLQLIGEYRLAPKDPGAKLVDDEALDRLTVTKPAEDIGLIEPIEEPFGLINPLAEPSDTAAPTVKSEDYIYIKIKKPRKSKIAVLSEGINNTEPAPLIHI